MNGFARPKYETVHSPQLTGWYIKLQLGLGFADLEKWGVGGYNK